MSFQSCRLPACKGSKLPKFQTPSPTCTLGPRQLPQQAPQGQATAMAFLGFQSCRLPARKPSKTLQNSPNPPNPPNAPNPPKPAKPSKHRPQQAPPNFQNSKHLPQQTPSPAGTSDPQQWLQIHSNDFLDAFKAALTEARATAMTFYGPQSCSLPACKGSKLPKFQTPSPTCTLGPRPLPQQAPQGQATAMAFLGFQSCRLPARKPSKTLQNSPNAPNPPKPAKPFKHRPQQAPQIHSNDNDFLWASKLLQFASLQRIQTSKIPNTFPNMHPRAKATSPTGTPGPGHSNGFLRLSKLPFASPQTLQNSPNAPNPPKPAKPFKHRPQQAPQIHSNDFLWASKLPFASLQRIQTSKIPNTFPNMHPRAQATSPTGTPGPGHSNGFLRLSKLPFASPQTLQNSPKLSKRSKPSKTRQTLQTPSPAGTSDPQQ